MKKMNFGILLIFAVLALVSVASAGLPSQVTATLAHPGPNGYWNVDVTAVVGGTDISTTVNYDGYCAASNLPITVGSKVFNVYSSLGALPAGLPTVNWNKVNYVLNHKAGADNATIQAVIWHYDGGPHSYPTVNWVKYQELVNAADANPTYVPGVGENYAVILWSSRNQQPVIIEVPIPDIPVPEFPTLALPIAMMIGVVGAVQFIKARKE